MRILIPSHLSWIIRYWSCVNRVEGIQRDIRSRRDASKLRLYMTSNIQNDCRKVSIEFFRKTQIPTVLFWKKKKESTSTKTWVVFTRWSDAVNMMSKIISDDTSKNYFKILNAMSLRMLTANSHGLWGALLESTFSCTKGRFRYIPWFIKKRLRFKTFKWQEWDASISLVYVHIAVCDKISGWSVCRWRSVREDTTHQSHLHDFELVTLRQMDVQDNSWNILHSDQNWTHIDSNDVITQKAIF